MNKQNNKIFLSAKKFFYFFQYIFVLLVEAKKFIMGIGGSTQNIPLETFDWELPNEKLEIRKYIISPVFSQQKEYFVAFINHDLNTIFIYCCSCSQWQYDECFTFTITLKIDQQVLSTTAIFSHQSPFCSITSRNLFGTISIGIQLCKDYPYTRKDRYCGILNSGSTCYMASILQVLFHTGSFRQLIYNFKDAKDAVAALQRLFTELQLSSRAPTLDSFIRSLGSFHELALVQNDAQEFFIAFIERCENDLGEEFTKGINNIFGCVTTTFIESLEKEVLRKKDERFYTFPVVVEGLKSLEESLNLITAKDKIESYETDDGRKIEAEQTQIFTKLPPILSFHLCRFSYNSKTNSVNEIRSPFDCPFELDMSRYSPGIQGETKYQLYAITAHSGNPVFGHYTSFIRPQLGEQWILFNDGNTKIVDIGVIRRLFGTEKSSQPSFFKAFTFTSALAYMIFYVRRDSFNYVSCSDSIPLHLVPHRSNLFFSQFIFTEELPNEPINSDSPPYEWADPHLTAETILKGLYPNKKLDHHKIWAQMPGRSQFIGPMDLQITPSDFIVKGHSTIFFLIPDSVVDDPTFVVTDSTPRKYLRCLERNNIKANDFGAYVIEYQHRPFDKVSYIPSGSFVISKPKKNVTLEIGFHRFVFPIDATYADVQKMLAIIFDIPPWRILVLHKMQPMLPSQYPYIISFPKTELSYQKLKDPVTACSIKLFTPITMICIAPNYTQQWQQPVWIRKGTSIPELFSIFPKYFTPHIKEKTKILCSIGKLEAIEYVIKKGDSPRKQCVRFDLIRYEVPYLRSDLKVILKEKRPMGIEIRFAESVNSFTFQGTSRIISTEKQMTVKDIWSKMMKASSNMASDPPKQAFVFVSEKPKIRQIIGPDDNVFEIFHKFLNKMTKDQQRLCIALVSDNPMIVSKPKSSIVRSLSGIINQKSPPKQNKVQEKPLSQET